MGYAPMPTFAIVAAVFGVALWAFARGGRPFREEPEWSGSTTKPRSTPITRLVSVYLLVFWLGLIAPLAFYSPRVVASAVTTQATSTVAVLNPVLIFSFGLVGALFLPAAIRRFDRAFQWLAALWILYLGWGTASLIWSVNPSLTARNLVAFVMVSIGCFGLGTGFYGRLPNGRDLFLRHVFWAGVLSALVILLPLPFRFQAYDLLSPTGRLDIGGNFGKYVVLPLMCVLLTLIATSILRVRRWQRRDWFWVAVFVIPLLALKSRGPILWGLLALGIFYVFYKTRIRDRVLQVGLLFVIGVGTYIYYTEDVLESTFGPLVQYLVRGNVEATTTLTGRVPLWQALVEQVWQHPWLGVGFAAFWGSLSELNSYLVEDLGAPSAHNGFLEELLGTGIVGLAILLAFCLGTLTVAGRRARRGDPFAWLVFLYMVYWLLLNTTNALSQEYFEPVFVLILMALGLMASKPAADSSILPGVPAAARRRTVAPRR